MVAPTVEQQLPAFLGKGVARLRKTDENPARSSVIDVAVALSGHGADYASQAVRNNDGLQIPWQGPAKNARYGRPGSR